MNRPISLPRWLPALVLRAGAVSAAEPSQRLAAFPARPAPEWLYHDIGSDLLRAEVVLGERGAAAMSAMHVTLDGVPLLHNPLVSDGAKSSVSAGKLTFELDACRHFMGKK